MGKKSGFSGFRSSSVGRTRTHSTRMSTRVSGRSFSGPRIRSTSSSTAFRNFSAQSRSTNIWDKLRTNPLPPTKQIHSTPRLVPTRHRNNHLWGYTLSERLRYGVEDFFMVQKTQPQPRSIYDQWDYKQKTLAMKVFAMMFAYVLKHDDDKISYRERRTFRKMIQLDKDRITEYDYRELMNLIRSTPTKDDVLQFLLKHEVPVDTITKTADRIDRIMKYDIKYTGETNEILQRYDVMKEYQ
ncbi:hypothetical protein [Candidatus Xianfuyuplasma coldseepsis]|uniref:Uncharacterized protein n=1 Tax=Candidatus Xianfuyuplasma coldseepsis TaxID=2782163 RepID=A0A7L7KRF9_9MOLU|nr:hypothetical protein [Xianfuyuplasma coldseepsis]QMS84862.1 hypothetical protein G4Z02_03535 [Xianfuyuplasma coldseepsis]